MTNIITVIKDRILKQEKQPSKHPKLFFNYLIDDLINYEKRFNKSKDTISQIMASENMKEEEVVETLPKIIKQNLLIYKEFENDAIKKELDNLVVELFTTELTNEKQSENFFFKIKENLNFNIIKSLINRLAPRLNELTLKINPRKEYVIYLLSQMSEESKKVIENHLNIVVFNGLELKSVSDDKKTEELCLASVKNNGLALEYVPDDKKTEDICLASVTNNGLALEFVPDNKKTEKIYLAAVKQNNGALIFVPDDKKTESIYLASVTNNGLALEFVPDNKKTEEICLAAVKKNNGALQFVPDNKKKPDFYSKIIMIDKSRYESYLENGNITLSQYIYEVLNSMKSLQSFVESESAVEKIINISDKTDYYTSFLEKPNYIQNLKSKATNFIWMSENIDQSIMHLFNSTRKNLPNSTDEEVIQPYIAKYNIENGTRIINSNEYTNKYIFNNIIPEECLSKILLIIAMDIWISQKNNPQVTNPLAKDYSVVENVERNKAYFLTESNKYILVILNELNKFLSDDKKIYGYKNFFDQKEIALCNRYKIIDTSIKISKYIYIEYTDSKEQILKFPCKYKDYSFVANKHPVAYGINTLSNNIRMVPKTIYFKQSVVKPLTICYENFNNPSEHIILVENKPLASYYEKKYLKYKSKYLSLKKK